MESSTPAPPPAHRDPSRWRGAASGATLAAAVAFAVFTPGARPYALTVLAMLGLIAIHEAGHLVAAKRAGVGASEFAVGFGPRLFATRPLGGTVYSLRALPLGGFVRISGMGSELSATPGTADEVGRKFGDVSRLRQLSILAAGPAANAAVTFVCLLILFGAAGMPHVTSSVDVVPGGPAAVAGIRDGDRVVSFAGTHVSSFASLVTAIAETDPAHQVPVVVERDGRETTVLARVDSVGGSVRLGVRGRTMVRRMAPLRAVRESVVATGRFAAVTAGSLGALGRSVLDTPARLFSGGHSRAGKPQARPLSPIGAAQMARDAQADMGATGPVLLIAAASMFLCLFNLLPLPPFDGGSIAVVAFEAVASRVRRRSVVVDRQQLGLVATAVAGLVMVLGVSALILDVLHPVTSR